MSGVNATRAGGLALLAAFVAAAGLKVWLVAAGRVPFNADEAVVALMARHITQGARPVFFYGQAYLGSLDAFLVAAGFAVFGQQVWVIRLVQGLLYLGTMASTVWLAREAGFPRWAGVLAVWLLAIPAVNVTLYTTASLGGYGEALLLGNLILLAALRIANLLGREEVVPAWLWLLWGALAGFGLWVFGLTLVYSLPAGVFLAYRVRGARGEGRRARCEVRGATQIDRKHPERTLSGVITKSKRQSKGAALARKGVLQDPHPSTSLRSAQDASTASERSSSELRSPSAQDAQRSEGQMSVRESSAPCADTLWRAAGLVLVGGLVGALPYWWGAYRLGVSQLLIELGGGAIAGVEGAGWLESVGMHLVSLLLLGSTVIFGLRPPWEVRWLAAPLIPFVLAFWGWVGLFVVRRIREGGRQREGVLLLCGVVFTLLAGFVFTPFGADPSGRYFLPLAVPLALFAAAMLVDLWPRSRGLAAALFAVVLVFHLWGTLQAAEYPPGLTTQFDAVTQIDHRYDDELIAFLRQQGIRRGYTNYWVAYPLAFLSQEELIFVPALPYHLDFRYTRRDNRYAPYNRLVAEAGQVAYITTNHPALEAFLRARFAELGVSWQEARIGDFQVFYGLSRAVRPEEIGLGEQREADVRR